MVLVGRTEPRIYTPPLYGRTLDETSSRGFAFIRWCEDVLGIDLQPFQRWLAIHALEVMPDAPDRYRWSTVVALMGRQISSAGSPRLPRASVSGSWSRTADD
jgi:hypothetical protein